MSFSQNTNNIVYGNVCGATLNSDPKKPTTRKTGLVHVISGQNFQNSEKIKTHVHQRGSYVNAIVSVLVDKYDNYWVVNYENIFRKYSKQISSHKRFAKTVFEMNCDKNCSIFEADALNLGSGGKYILYKSENNTLQKFSSRFNKRIVKLTIPTLAGMKNRNMTDFELSNSSSIMPIGFMNNGQFDAIETVFDDRENSKSKFYYLVRLYPTAFVYSPLERKVIQNLNLFSEVTALSISPDESAIAFGCFNDKEGEDAFSRIVVYKKKFGEKNAKFEFVNVINTNMDFLNNKVDVISQLNFFEVVAEHSKKKKLLLLKSSSG